MPRAPKILVAPGIGDIHWVMLKMESMIANRFDGVMPEIWVWSASAAKDRARGYIERLPFVKWGGYFDARAHRALGDKVFVSGDPWAMTDWQGFDLFVAFNAPLGQGKSITALMPNHSINWNYEIRLKDNDESVARGNLITGPYVLFSFFDHGFYGKWLEHFSPLRINNLISNVHSLGYQAVFTGREWDMKFMKSIRSIDYVDLVGRTSIGELFGLMKHACAFIGFAAGNGMLAQHLGCETFMLWHPKQWHPDFATNWVEPQRVGKSYHALAIDSPCVDYIEEKLGKASVSSDGSGVLW